MKPDPDPDTLTLPAMVAGLLAIAALAVAAPWWIQQLLGH